MLFVNGADDDATACAFSRGCWEVNGRAEKAIGGGLSHLSKYDFLNIVSIFDTLIAGLCDQIVKNTGSVKQQSLAPIVRCKSNSNMTCCFLFVHNPIL
jgi:hypothetical protein